VGTFGVRAADATRKRSRSCSLYEWGRLAFEQRMRPEKRSRSCSLYEWGRLAFEQRMRPEKRSRSCSLYEWGTFGVRAADATRKEEQELLAV
jgi:hypothetical protein